MLISRALWYLMDFASAYKHHLLCWFCLWIWFHLQKAELRCLLPKSSLNHGFFSERNEDSKKSLVGQSYNYSWSGQRKVPSYLSKLVFPQEFLVALRTIAMQEHELRQVVSLLEEVKVVSFYPKMDMFILYTNGWMRQFIYSVNDV